MMKQNSTFRAKALRRQASYQYILLFEQMVPNEKWDLKQI